jgi:hypothetical protein
MLVFNIGFYDGQLINTEECYLSFIKYNKNHKFVINSPISCKNELESSNILKNVKKYYFNERKNISRYSNIIDGFLEVKKETKEPICILEPDIRFIKNIPNLEIKYPLFMKALNKELDYIVKKQIDIASLLKVKYNKDFNYFASGAIIPFNSNVIENIEKTYFKFKKIYSIYYKINKYISIEEIFMQHYLKNKTDNFYIRNFDQNIKSETFMIHYEDYKEINEINEEKEKNEEKEFVNFK